ncbi:hypothetical protein BH09BAC1_BH09BAC1_07730 [soil metagenome]
MAKTKCYEDCCCFFIANRNHQLEISALHLNKPPWLTKDEPQKDDLLTHKMEEERTMRQEYTKLNTPLVSTMTAPQAMPMNGEQLMKIADQVQNPLQFVTNFASLNIELLAELKSAIMADNHYEIDAIIQNIKSNCLCIESHGKRASQVIKQLQEKR